MAAQIHSYVTFYYPFFFFFFYCAGSCDKVTVDVANSYREDRSIHKDVLN